MIGIVAFRCPSISLATDGLADPIARQILYIDPADRDITEKLARCSILIASRAVDHASVRAVIDSARKLGVPWFYFFDDNFFEIGKAEPALGWFASAECETFVSSCHGMIVTSDSLEAYTRARFAKPVHRLGPMIDRRLLPAPRPTARQPIVFALPGGNHRYGSVPSVILPAIQSAFDRPRLVVRDAQHFPDVAGVEILTGGLTLNFPDFLRAWRSQIPQVLVHPPSGSAANIHNKTDNIVMVSYLLGCVPVVYDEAAYQDLGEAEGVIKVTCNTIEAWREALLKAADPQTRARLLDDLALFCEIRFSPVRNENTFANLLAKYHPPIWRRIAWAIGRRFSRASA